MTVAAASLRHSPSMRLVMTCMCVWYSDMKYDIDVVSHYSTNLTIGFKGKSPYSGFRKSLWLSSAANALASGSAL